MAKDERKNDPVHTVSGGGGALLAVEHNRRLLDDGRPGRQAAPEGADRRQEPGVVLCFAHTSEAGAWFDLPLQKPDGWPTPTQLAEIGIRALEHEEPAEGQMCVCCECCDKRAPQEED
jgi:hypothetical protein